jgi:hypothetical protein
VGEVDEGESVSGIGALAGYLVFISSIQIYYNEYNDAEHFEKEVCA